MTPDEAKQVLAAAKDASGNEQWRDVIHLLEPVHAAHLLAGHDQGDAAYLLGLAHTQLGDWQTASGLLTEGSATAAAENRGYCQELLNQIKHHYKATDAEADGVSRKEGHSVLIAADEALGASNYDEAYRHYWAVFDGNPSDADRARAALGIARVFVYRDHDFTQARQYADYAASTHGSRVAGEAHQLVAWLKEQTDAAKAAEDGTTIDEYGKALAAAEDAFDAEDYRDAHRLYVSIASAAQLNSAQRGDAAYNAGLCALLLGQDAEARQQFEFAAAHGRPDIGKQAHDRLAEMDRHDAAEALVEKLVRS